MWITNPVFLAVFTLFLVAGPSVSQAAEPVPPAGITTIVLVRHAEKASEESDPGLTEAGEARAQALAALFARTPIDAVYATPFQRTRATVAPLAAELGQDVRELPLSRERMAEHGADTVALILEKHAGRTVVIAGHSNTVPMILEALGVTPAPVIEESEYGDLFLVTLIDGHTAMLRMRYGG